MSTKTKFSASRQSTIETASDVIGAIAHETPVVKEAPVAEAPKTAPAPAPAKPVVKSQPIPAKPITIPTVGSGKTIIVMPNFVRYVPYSEKEVKDAWAKAKMAGKTPMEFYKSITDDVGVNGASHYNGYDLAFAEAMSAPVPGIARVKLV